MNQFEEIKNEILERARKARACSGQYKRAYQSENIETLCDVIKDNFWWCCRNDVLDGELIDNYGEIFSENKIYHNVSVKNGFLLVSGNSTVKAYGNSTVEAYNKSYINCCSTVECVIKDNSIVRRWDLNTIQYASDKLKFEKILA